MSNTTSVQPFICTYPGMESTDMIVSILFLCLFPVALLLNGVAAWVSLHLRSTSTFIVYLKNLVAADLLMTLTLPLMAASLIGGIDDRFRAFTCRYSDVVFFCSLYTNISLMGFISLDRFFKIVRPFGKVLGQNVMFSIATSSLVWLVLFGGTAIPTMILTDREPTNDTDNFCLSLKSPSGLRLHVFVVLSMESLFWVVSMLVVFCYIGITMKVLQSFRNSGSSNSQGKKKTKLRVFLILLVFFGCFLPLHIVRVPVAFEEVCSDLWIEILRRFAIWISTTNACLDPVLYIYLCREYRDKLVDMMKSRGVCVGLHISEKKETA